MEVAAYGVLGFSISICIFILCRRCAVNFEASTESTSSFHQVFHRVCKVASFIFALFSSLYRFTHFCVLCLYLMSEFSCLNVQCMFIRVFGCVFHQCKNLLILLIDLRGRDRLSDRLMGRDRLSDRLRKRKKRKR